MKTQLIKINSLDNHVQVSIERPNSKPMMRRFPSIEQAIRFVLPRGNRQTELLLNGFRCVLHGWVQ
jgi:hypothetical protein